MNLFNTGVQIAKMKTHKPYRDLYNMSMRDIIQAI